METISNTMRPCPDIGMFTLDRPIPVSCIHATDFCKATCYNDKLYRMYPAMADKDKRNEQAWQNISPETARQWAQSLKRKRNQTDRVRLMSRGEAFRDQSDIERVLMLAQAAPDTWLWIPTRSWRKPVLFLQVLAAFRNVANVVILASTDPTTTLEEQQWLDGLDVSTMFYGDDSQLETLSGIQRFKCPKTHGVKGDIPACVKCKNGCFKPLTKGQSVHVHLLQH